MNRTRIPWTHVLGKEQKHGGTSAGHAYADFGPYNVGLAPVSYERAINDVFDSRRISMVREKIPNTNAIVGDKGGEDRVYGIVGSRYHLITPDTLVGLWDEHIGRPVTSIGAVDKGERFFIATKLPGFDIKGSEVENTLVLTSPMNGREALTAMLAPIHLVCTNGLVSIGEAVSAFRMRHFRDNISRLAEWLANVYQSSIAQLEVVEEAYNVLAQTKATPELMTAALDAAYPFPTLPENPTMEEIARGNRDFEFAEVRRRQARRLYAVDGTGADIPANNGTAFGLFNAVAELIDYGVPGEVRRTSARSAAFGSGADTKRRTLNALLRAA